MNIFEYSAKNKLRYFTDRGYITTEDLYDLPLESREKVSLNSVAKAVNKELKNLEEESFVTTVTPANTSAQVKLSVVKEIIRQRLELAQAKKDTEHQKARKEIIAAVIAEKQNDNLKNMSLEELQAELAK